MWSHNRTIPISMLICSLLTSASAQAKSRPTPMNYTSRELIAKIIDSERKIHDVQAECVFFDIETKWPVMYFEWGYEGGKEFIAGIGFVRADDNCGYKVSEKVKYSSGPKQHYYCFREDIQDGRREGQIKPLSVFDSDTFRVYMTPNSLLGFGVTCGVRQTFGEALQKAQKVVVLKEPQELDGHQCLVLEATGIEDIERTLDARAWLDPSRDFRPLKVEIFYGASTNRKYERFKKIFRKIYEIKLTQISGIWFPIEGKRQTHDDAPRRIKVDLESVRINRGIPPEKFVIRFPPGCEVRDDFRKTTYVVGAEDHAGKDISPVVNIQLSKLKRLAPPELMRMIYPDSLVGTNLADLIDPGINIDTGQADKAILACFWDMQQRPSRNCLRQLSTRAQELKARDIVVVPIQAAKVDRKTLDEWIKKNNIPFPVGMVQGDEKETRFSWGVKSLPWLILTDRQHIVRAEGFALNELNDRIKEVAEAELSRCP
jgi:hypothetical protein